MRARILALGIGLHGTVAVADGYVLGAGRWSCADVIETHEQGSPIRQGQVVGWLLGYWSAATFQRETRFVDIVEQVGGRKIYEANIAECRKAPPETLLYRVADSMIENTK